MSNPIVIKRTNAEGIAKVLKHGVHIADIYRSSPGQFGHDPEVPWVLEAVTGRIDRFHLRGEATDEAHKI